MGEATAFQPNQPQGFQQQPQWGPLPPQPISQYNLYLQQQQQLQGYNANPYGVPYSNPPVGGAYNNKICNPCCGRCKKGNCNLRRNCIAIAVYLIIAGLYQIFNAATPLPIRKECEGKDTSNCSKIQAIVMGLMVLYCLMVILSIASGILLLLAVFKPRSGWAALGAGMLMIFISLMLLANTILLPYTFIVFWEEIDWSEFQKDMSPYSTPTDISQMIPVILFTILFGLISVGVNIWLVVCVVQFSRQIKAGVDKDPVDGPPPQIPPPPTPLGYASQAPLDASSSAPPPYDAGSPTL